MSTTYMNLNLPTPTITIGPAWATQLNAAIESIDSHDHTSSKGKKIPTAGLNINADLDCGEFSLFNALSLKLSPLTATLTGTTNASSIYSVNGNLYWTNGSGTAVQITTGGSLAAVPGSAQSFEKTSIAGDLTISPSDTFSIISVDTSAARSITMPSVSAVTSGRVYIIKDATGNSLANPITITPDGSDTIDGESSITLNSDTGSLMLTSDGTSNWEVQ